MSTHLDPEAVRRLSAFGQDHLVRHARTLEPDVAAGFLARAAAQPWEEVRAALDAPALSVTPALRPPHALTLRRLEGEGGLARRLEDVGRGLLRGGRVATLLLAGGQGSRLGFDGPKGNFVLGPEADRDLYAIQAEKVAAASRVAGKPVPFVVLVSAGTAAATRQAFAEKGAQWGLEPGQVRLIEQRQLPAVDGDGCALLAGPGRLALAPDGHGGALRALREEGVLAAWVEAGVDVVTTYQVDNPLAWPLDPVMLGWMVERRAQAMGKAIRRLPEEKVGVFARDIQGRHLVVEYSEFPEGGLPEELKLGSIALHAFSVRWLHEQFESGLSLPFHLAWKKVPHLDETGRLVEPETPNAWKLEQFIFDVIPLAERAEVHEVDRPREFAPVKNAEGVDSPETARELVTAELRRRYAAADRAVPEPPSFRPRDLPGGGLR